MSDISATAGLSGSGQLSAAGVVGKRPKGRSPAYPSIDLEKAVQRVGQIYAKERQYAVSTSVLPGIWGYSALNGPAAQQLSALLKFGLLSDDGSKDERTIKVTDLAVQILNHPSSDAREEAIKEAALLPSIHRELWEQYGTQLPSDSNLLWRLTRERGFTDTGAREFIREWRDTMKYANLGVEDAQAVISDGLTMSDDLDVEFIPGTDEGGNRLTIVRNPEAGATSPRVHPVSGVVNAASSASGTAESIQSYPIPIALSGRPPVVISGAFPLSESEWTRFTAVLDAMKPVLVGDPIPVPPSDHPSIAKGAEVVKDMYGED